MNINGRQVSISVLVSFFVTLSAAVGGTWVAIVHNWGTTDPGALAIAIAGAIGVTVTAAVHTWDSMPANVTPAPVVPPKVP